MKRSTQRKRSAKRHSSIMRGTAVSFMLRAVIATALCTSFIIYPQLRISTVKAAHAAVANDVTETQLRNQATAYQNALGAIAGIAAVKLETPDDLKQALAIFDRARPGLKFFNSKLVVIAISDSAFSSAVKKKASSKLAAEAFLEELKADPKVVSRLDGAATLTTRLQQTAQADAAILRRVAERLKDAAQRIKNTGQRNAPDDFGATSEFKLLRAGFTITSQPANSSVMPAQGPVVGLILFAAVVVILLVTAKVVTTPPGRDPFGECIGAADLRYFNCIDEASSLPFPLDIAAKTLCAATFMAEEAACLVLP